MDNFKNRKILFFCPKFYSYSSLIQREIEDLGASVYYFDERASNSFIYKLMLRLRLGFFFHYKTINYYKSILEQYDDITDIFVINAEALTPHILFKLKEKYLDAKFTLYMWDSIKNKKNTVKLLSFFDVVFSFDIEDANKFKKIKYEPLFYNRGFGEGNNKSLKYNLSFIGSIHSDRLELINEINKLEMEGTYFFLYSPSKIFSYVKLFLSSKLKFHNRRLISYSKLNMDTVVKIFSESKAIIDIHHPNQNGLTMRTFEVLGAGKKLITTNPNIKKHQFYNEDNIFFLERGNIDKGKLVEFIDRKLDSNINDEIRKQRIDAWIKRVLL